jgi:hypothetical protein
VMCLPLGAVCDPADTANPCCSGFCNTVGVEFPTCSVPA